MESIHSNFKLLKNESKIYQFLNNNEGFPSVKWFGKDKINYYMVINLLGDSLQTLMTKKKSFSLKLVLQIGVQIINLLKILHENGFVHRDIKPENFLLGLNNKSKQIHMIDFGFCKSYLVNNKHIELENTSDIIGTPNFISVNAHNRKELSRRDDLESLGYMLLFFYNEGNLVWSEISSNEMMMIMKYSYVEEERNNLIRKDQVLIDFIIMVRKLEFKETPDYEGLIKMFQNLI
jgi:serine/threonine protein kinase